MPNQLELLYFQVTDLWKQLCERHADLFDLTTEEYHTLLESDMNRLDSIILQKEEIVTHIGLLEDLRQELIGKVNLCLANQSDKKYSIVQNVSELLKVMSDVGPEMEQKHLFKFNSLLIDIIASIQAQNKKNQIFINKALDSLKKLREDAIGGKKFSIYTSKGKETTNTTGSINRKC